MSTDQEKKPLETRGEAELEARGPLAVDDQTLRELIEIQRDSSRNELERIKKEYALQRLSMEYSDKSVSAQLQDRSEQRRLGLRLAGVASVTVLLIAAGALYFLIKMAELGKDALLQELGGSIVELISYAVVGLLSFFAGKFNERSKARIDDSFSGSDLE